MKTTKISVWAACGVIFAVLGAPAHAASCADQIVAAQALLDSAIAKHAKNSSSQIETTAAKRHFQPTPETLAAAEKAPTGVLVANDLLEKAREADYRNDSEGCQSFLKQAEDAMGIKIKMK